MLPRIVMQTTTQLPENSKMAKDIPIALLKASTVFVTYLSESLAFFSGNNDQVISISGHVSPH